MANKDIIANLECRAGVLATLRKFFAREHFIEVETAIRISAPAPEVHIDCPASGDAFLRASPELQMKKLLALGMPRIYQIGACFREGERGRRHNPEFTMLEWYRLQSDYRILAEDAEALLRAVLGERVGMSHLPRICVRDAYRQWAGWDPWVAWDGERFDYDMATIIEPHLPAGGVFLTDYPVQAASLARIRGDIAERWELYFDGMELANCFTELCDGDEQRKRFNFARAERHRLGEADYPLDEEFLEMLPMISSAAGAALGVDRLVMLAAGVSSITEIRAPE